MSRERCEVGSRSDEPCHRDAVSYIEPSRAPGGYGMRGYWACEKCIRKHGLEECINPAEVP